MANITGSFGNDQLEGTNQADYMDGGFGNDTLDGGNGDDTLYGRDGDDSLEGGLGYDIFYGGAGNDTLKGGLYSDSLLGGTGNDFLYGIVGGLNFDTLTGGEGADTFVLQEEPEYYTEIPYATITDFNRSEGDKIQVFGNLGDYSLEIETTLGDTTPNTLIRYLGNIIAIAQDTTEVSLSSDFIFVAIAT
jgi:Ca2+-binding RTX toxin-like protein